MHDLRLHSGNISTYIKLGPGHGCQVIKWAVVRHADIERGKGLDLNTQSLEAERAVQREAQNTSPIGRNSLCEGLTHCEEKRDVFPCGRVDSGDE